MNKKLLTLAVGAALAMTSGMAAAEVNWYGKFNMNIVGGGYGNTSYDAATDDEGATDIAADGSRLGLRASDDLGNGMEAFVWSEWIMDPADATGQFVNRDSLVGFRGDFGTVAAGNAGTPYKAVGANWDMFMDTPGDVNQQPSDKDAGNQGYSFFEQPAGTGIGYSNSVGDISFAIGHSTENGDANDTADKDTSFNVVYSADMLTVKGAWYSLDSGDDDQDHGYVTLGAIFNLGQFGVQVAMQNASYDNQGAFGDVKTQTLSLGGSVSINSATKAKLQYSTMSNENDVEDRDYSLMALGLDHSLSKSTSVGAVYSTQGGDAEKSGWAVGMTVKF